LTGLLQKQIANMVLGNSKKEEENENVEQLEDENKVSSQNTSCATIFCSFLEYLAQHNLSAETWHGFNQDNASDICPRAEEYA
jgi:hypothetical protein